MGTQVAKSLATVVLIIGACQSPRDSFSLPTTWGALRSILPGPGEISSGEIGTRVTVCSHPRLAFPIDLPFSRAGVESLTPDSIRPYTSIKTIEVWHDDTVPC